MTLQLPGSELPPRIMRVLVEQPGATRQDIAEELRSVHKRTINTSIQWLKPRYLYQSDETVSYPGVKVPATKLFPTERFWDEHSRLQEKVETGLSAEKRILYDEALAIREQPATGSLSDHLRREAEYIGRTCILAKYCSELNHEGLFCGQEGWNLLITGQIFGPDRNI